MRLSHPPATSRAQKAHLQAIAPCDCTIRWRSLNDVIQRCLLEMRLVADSAGCYKIRSPTKLRPRAFLWLVQVVIVPDRSEVHTQCCGCAESLNNFCWKSASALSKYFCLMLVELQATTNAVSTQICSGPSDVSASFTFDDSPLFTDGRLSHSWFLFGENESTSARTSTVALAGGVRDLQLVDTATVHECITWARWDLVQVTRETATTPEDLVCSVVGGLCLQPLCSIDSNFWDRRRVAQCTPSGNSRSRRYLVVLHTRSSSAQPSFQMLSSLCLAATSRRLAGSHPRPCQLPPRVS